MFKVLTSLFSPKVSGLDEKNLRRISRECESLKLYHIHDCPFCVKVRKATKQLCLNIEQRDININKEWEKELISHGGSCQAPCLRISNPDGTTQWMYESIAIINYLTDRFKK